MEPCVHSLVWDASDMDLVSPLRLPWMFTCTIQTTLQNWHNWQLLFRRFTAQVTQQQSPGLAKATEPYNKPAIMSIETPRSQILR